MDEQRIHHENVSGLVEGADHASDERVRKIHLAAKSDIREVIVVRNTTQASTSRKGTEGSGRRGKVDIKDQASFVEETTSLVGRDRWKKRSNPQASDVEWVGKEE